MATKRAVATASWRKCAAGVCDPERTEGLKAPAPNGTYPLVTLKGPGVFLGAEVTKQGGTNDLTFVILDIDGRNVTNLSFAGALNQGLTQQNPYGLVVLNAGRAQDDDGRISHAASLQAKPDVERDRQRSRTLCKFLPTSSTAAPDISRGFAVEQRA